MYLAQHSWHDKRVEMITISTRSIKEIAGVRFEAAAKSRTYLYRFLLTSIHCFGSLSITSARIQSEADQPNGKQRDACGLGHSCAAAVCEARRKGTAKDFFRRQEQPVGMCPVKLVAKGDVITGISD
jgi:hypothetical protein